MTNYLEYFTYDIFLQLVIIILSTLIVAKIVTVILVFASKVIAKKTKTDIDDQIIESFRGPIFYTIVFSGIYFSVRIILFGEVAKELTLPFFQTFLIIIWVIFFTRITKIVLAYFVTVHRVHFITVQTLPLFLNASIVLVWIITAYFIFSVWHIDMTAWLASAGVAGIAIGLAAKDTIANLISGVFILTDAPFQIGDFIVLDSGERGHVTDIGMRTTRIKTMDDTEITVPNAVIGNATLTNESGGISGKKFRVKVPFGVAYGVDIDYVEKIVLDIARAHDAIMHEPEPRVRFRLFGASSLDFDLLCWIEESSKRGLAVHEINKAIYKAFTHNGIEIPYTKQDLYIKEFPTKDGHIS